MLRVRILVHRSGQPEETHENVVYFRPTVSQSIVEREERESKRHQSCDRPTYRVVSRGILWYGVA